MARPYAAYATAILAPAILAYREGASEDISHRLVPLKDNDDLASIVTDMLADIHHVCDHFGYDYEAFVTRAEDYYQSEKNTPHPEEN